MKERLIEVLTDSEIAYAQYLSEKCDKAIKGDITEQLLKRLEFYADYLLENGAIVPPCKVGQTVYTLWETPTLYTESKYILYCAEVKEIRQSKRNGMIVNTYLLESVEFRGRRREFLDCDFGKTVFDTKEEALKALGGVEG